MQYKKRLLGFFHNITNIKFLAYRATIYYFLLGSTWVLISDKLSAAFAKNTKSMTIIGIAKGWVYVLLTSILLYKIISKSVNRNQILSNSLKNNYDELSAAEEELRAQFEELTVTKDLLRKNEERYELALNCSNDCIWELNLATNEFYASDKWKYITGYEIPKSLNIREFIKNFVIRDDREKFIALFRQQMSNSDSELDFSLEFRFKVKNTLYKWVLFKGRYLKETKNTPRRILGIMIDISKQKGIEEKIDYLAHHDSLTNLLNRVSFIDKLETEIEKHKKNKKKIAVIFLDIDNFKNINDILGHDFGDRLLILFSKILCSNLSANDFACRIGGDEFLIAATCLNNENDIHMISDKILNIFKEPFNVYRKQIDLTASIGISVYPDDALEPISLMKNSDIAMYEAKRDGKNRYFLYNRNLIDALLRKSKIEAGLKDAIQNDGFDIFYQPKIKANANTLSGFEALLRWKSPELGMVSPAEFIPIAEESDLIIEIGSWVMQNACKQINIWNALGLNYGTISINVSSAQFMQHDFVNKVKNIISESKVNPKQIEIEITETLIMVNIEESINKMQKLQEIGITISLDDFGTGYSSLNYLRRIPINIIKIDKSFIDNICFNYEDRAVTNFIIQFAHQLNYEVVAEGIETSEQLEILKEMHCDKIQGYYFSKPLPKDKAKEFILSSSK